MPYKVHIGGLLRCCLATLEELDELGQLPTEAGSLVTCKYCKQESLILEDDYVWRWSRKHG